jgi:3-hydroxybutyryl-CoA dehydrogenase
MRVLVLGAGLMGAQIGCEYALGGHDVTMTARNTARVADRVEDTLAKAVDLALHSQQAADEARTRIEIDGELAAEGWGLVVESVPEDAELKAELLRPFAQGSPAAILATNTSSLSITALGEAIGAPDRTIGTHYWNPPLLMPLVEVVAGDGTAPETVSATRDTLHGLGKRPVLVRDVPGFVWNRIQMAVLREATWIVEHGAADTRTVDEILTHGLARRWRSIGFFDAITLGGVATWQRTSANLLPELSTATELPDLRRLAPDPAELADVAARRDQGLARDLLDERGERVAG